MANEAQRVEELLERISSVPVSCAVDRHGIYYIQFYLEDGGEITLEPATNDTDGFDVPIIIAGQHED